MWAWRTQAVCRYERIEGVWGRSWPPAGDGCVVVAQGRSESVGRVDGDAEVRGDLAAGFGDSADLVRSNTVS